MTYTSRSSGNAFIYVLISVILLGALSFALSRGNDSNPSGEISAAAAKAAATSILAYESQARAAVDQMTQTGASIDNIDFSLPSDAAFNTAPTVNKLFHPDGGGLQYKPLPTTAYGYKSPAVLPDYGYFIGRFNNFEWTQTTSQEVVFTVYGLNKFVCEELNRKITGSTTIPATATGVLRQYFIKDTYCTPSCTNVTFTIAACPICEGKPALCVATNGTPATYAYYSLLVAR